MWSNKDYTEKKKSYENMKSDLDSIMISSDSYGMKIQKITKIL